MNPTISLTELRQRLFQLADQVAETGEPLDETHVANLRPIVLSMAAADQVSSRTASRNRSVAAKTTDWPEISTRIPVSIGNVSSRPAATAT